MKSLFDFIGKAEATRGVRRWSWTFVDVEIIKYLLHKLSGEVSLTAFYFQIIKLAK
ncbi:hypothetical protein [Mesobacillus selenatarsenatis]|uniref:hypothetical protein n=1 Tax=Mesobacillus selenatarsenatis TaxID=388741 RepID=UPI0012EC4E52|nr:hypothetical protein [Mesobacillus selenatarsenatis]